MGSIADDEKELQKILNDLGKPDGTVYDTPWVLSVKGHRDGDWEIALVRTGFVHGLRSWGWCDTDISKYRECKKVLVGSYCRHSSGGTQIPAMFDAAVELGSQALEQMQAGEFPRKITYNK